MDTRALFLSTALAGVFACSQAPTSDAGSAAAVAGVARTVSEVAITSGTPVTFADLSVEGMSCEMMCGGSIKKALAALPGVVGTEIKFEEGEAVDHAIVTFDPAQVNDAQLVEAVQKIH
ncbi:MAG: heavy-metal-associated domain-containing protein, partial [Flavobacteriales bacterium]|nr:heavy-metal-associated domain-containing protein [Flavobacteriales bacterium]